MIERESKYTVLEPATLDAIEALRSIGPLPVTGRRTERLRDEYFDTPSRELSKAHASLRIRRKDDEVLFTAKSGSVYSGISRRIEVEEPAVGRIQDWLKSLMAAGRICLCIDVDQLASSLRIENNRRVLCAADSGTEVEIGLDRATFQGPRGTQEDLELEIELVDGSEAVLLEVSEWLRNRYALEGSRSSKYQRAAHAVG